MNVSTVTTSTTTHTTTVNNKTYKIEMIEDGQMSGQSDDDDDDPPSSPGSGYGDGQDIMQMTMGDEVTSQLAAAGPVGVAAAAAIASAKKRKRPHSFETNPSIRKRQQNRLLRKLRQIIYEFTGRVGQQAIVLVATPGKPNTSYKVFGAKPLEDVVRNLKSIVMEELETALAQQAPPPPQEDPSLFELPPLIIDGIPTPVEKMTQAQLRAFIPLMLKYSTGRGKPGWGRESTRPPWWPKELPWANVRMDARTEEEKQKISWTHALRKIVINCYRYHGREDLLPTFSDEEDKVNQIVNSANANTTTNNNNVGVLKLHSSGTTIVTNNSNNNSSQTTTAVAATNTGSTTKQIEIQTTQNAAQTIANAQVCLDPLALTDVDYTQAVLSTIQNADGTVSLIQVDPNNPIITLPDGTTAQVQGVATLHTTAQGETGATIQTVQSLADANGHTENMTVDLTEATLAQDGQIIITGEDGQGYPVSVSSMITVPVSASMYQTMVANIQQLHPNGDGTVCITPMQVDNITSNQNSNDNNNNNSNNSNNFQQQQQLHSSSSSSPSLSSSSSATTINYIPAIAVANASSPSSLNQSGGGGVGNGATVVNGKMFRAIIQNRQLRCQLNSSQMITQSKVIVPFNNNNNDHNHNLHYSNSQLIPSTRSTKKRKQQHQQQQQQPKQHQSLSYFQDNKDPLLISPIKSISPSNSFVKNEFESIIKIEPSSLLHQSSENPSSNAVVSCKENPNDNDKNNNNKNTNNDSNNTSINNDNNNVDSSATNDLNVDVKLIQSTHNDDDDDIELLSASTTIKTEENSPKKDNA